MNGDSGVVPAVLKSIQEEIEDEWRYIDEFKPFPPDELAELLRENDGSPVFNLYGTLFCAECGATHWRDFLDPTQDYERPLDFHWRPKCSQPIGAGWERED